MNIEITLAGVSKIIAIIITVGSLLVGAGVFIHTAQTTEEDVCSLREDMAKMRLEITSFKITLMRIETELKYKKGLGGGGSGVGVLGRSPKIRLMPKASTLHIGSL